jgi:hypothetical protein
MERPLDSARTHFFSAFDVPGSPPPNALMHELRGLGLEVIADEELTGDGFWHVAAFERGHIGSVGAEALRDAAVNNGASYDGSQERRDNAQ